MDRQIVTECLAPSMLTSTLTHVELLPCVSGSGWADAVTLIEWVGSALDRKMLDAMPLPKESKLLAAAAACK